MATYFPPSSDHNQNHGDPSQQQQILFPGLQPNTLGSAMHPSFNGSNTTMPFDIEALGSLMQGIEGQAPLSPNQQAASYNPHMMLEQQFKLTQLQQLQQLQNQIFQQQVSKHTFAKAGSRSYMHDHWSNGRTLPGSILRNECKIADIHCRWH